jgi:hypothetical protein
MILCVGPASALALSGGIAMKMMLAMGLDPKNVRRPCQLHWHFFLHTVNLVGLLLIVCVRGCGG